MKELAKAFDAEFDMTSDEKEAARCCVERIRRFNMQAGLPQTLAEINVKKEDFEALAQSAYTDASTPDNPREVNVEILKALYEKMYA